MGVSKVRRSLMIITFLALVGLIVGSTLAAAGSLAFNYGTTGLSSPTGEKTQSKIWYTSDGLWWGDLYNNTAQEYRIYKFDPKNTGAGWVDTGVVLDARNTSKADVLWDGGKLHVVSHSSNGETNVPQNANPKYYYRYSYNSTTKSWANDVRDVVITGADGATESVVLDKDSTGRLWVTYTLGDAVSNTAKVKVSTSNDNGATWTTFDLNAADSNNLSTDDVSALVAYQGRIGLMWSNQTTKQFYFAVHADGAATNSWTSSAVYSSATGGDAADDHINLKVQADASGRLFAVIKTGLGIGSPDIVVLECLSGTCASVSNWQAFTVYSGVSPSTNEHTRPQLLIDSENSRLYVFTTQPTAGGAIYYAVAPIGGAFSGSPTGAFIQGGNGVVLNDPTTTKQTVNGNSGIVVVASDTANRDYWYNYMALPKINYTNRLYLPLVTK